MICSLILFLDHFDFPSFIFFFFFFLFSNHIIIYFVLFLLLFLLIFFKLLSIKFFDTNPVQNPTSPHTLATLNGHAYSTFIGPVPSNGSPGLPLTLDNSTSTPNPSITTTSNTSGGGGGGDVEDGSTTTSALNKYEPVPSKYEQSGGGGGSQSQQQHDHHHSHDIDNRSFPTDQSPNDQSSLIILQPSGTSSEIGSTNSATGLGAYSPMLPSFSHYAPGKYTQTKTHNPFWLTTLRKFAAT